MPWSRRQVPGLTVAGLTCITALAVAAGAARPTPEHPARPPEAAMPVAGAISRCRSCHHLDRVLTHPVDVVPSMTVPRHLPLVEGKVTCITCHDHRSQQHRRARQRHTDLLRDASGAAGLCGQCHDPQGGSRRDMHAMMLGRAHLALLPANETKAAPAGTRDVAPPDLESATCLGCHDGSVAGDAADHTGLTGAARLRALGPPTRNHPIGVAYHPPPGRDGDGAGGQDSTFDGRIRLFDDRVGCGSCHSPFSDRRALLVMSNQGSRLCLNCHRF
ncbi:MAG: cytochrome c3 family protein [Planctomycetota bacterium]